jgi:uncharacterized protein (TIGR03067 family)
MLPREVCSFPEKVMWRFTLTILAGGLLTSVDAPKSDLDMFQGTWNVAHHRGYIANCGGTEERALVVFDGNNLILKTKDREKKTAFRIDSAKTPKTFDLQGKLWKFPVWLPGCYEMYRDAMRIRWSEEGKRPLSVSSTLEKGQTELILIREKPVK